MRKIIFIFVAIAILSWSCGSQASKESGKANNDAKGNSSASEAIKLTPENVAESAIEGLSEIEGEFSSACKFRDKNGENLLVFTKEESFERDRSISEIEAGILHATLRFYQYTGEKDNYKLLRTVQEKAAPCSTPPSALDAKFIEDALLVSDLNENGIAEVTFMYSFFCGSNIYPNPHRLVVLENGREAKISGTKYLRECECGGKMMLNDAFEQLDEKIKAQAMQLWEKHSPLNPDPSKRDLLTLKSLQGLIFAGVEPNWFVKFKADKIEYSADGGNSTSLIYKSVRNHSDNLIITAEYGEAGGPELRFTISERECTDGMSDNRYPYSVHLAISQDEHYESYEACGRRQ